MTAALALARINTAVIVESLRSAAQCNAVMPSPMRRWARESRL
jgi:hypothetical protein